MPTDGKAQSKRATGRGRARCLPTTRKIIEIKIGSSKSKTLCWPTIANNTTENEGEYTETRRGWTIWLVLQRRRKSRFTRPMVTNKTERNGTGRENEFLTDQQWSVPLKNSMQQSTNPSKRRKHQIIITSDINQYENVQWMTHGDTSQCDELSLPYQTMKSRYWQLYLSRS